MKLLTFIWFLLFSLIHKVYAHNVLLPAYGRRCFFEQLGRGDELSISFQFGNRDPQSSEQLTGDFIVYGASRGEELKFLRDVSHGEVTINANADGKYKYCFLNERSGIVTKDVSFNIYGVVYVDLDDPVSNTLDGAVRRLSKLTKEIKNEQSYIVIRERTHRNTAESTNDRVKWWSIFQLAVVVAQSLFQIYYLKRFFEVTSYV
ncbi:HCL281Cp [Eremothecium sinecaudum]|uniref:HCL281Cp n=1 Tax=Eremothecium sinecaudum TaxID=45286 RepID=A0A109UWI8_9SACH|nr:HCL281Cp [Eremothecium sinecaudum]AMD19870.1 HCL281Cp [Eremothecium sinecaudum]